MISCGWPTAEGQPFDFVEGDLGGEVYLDDIRSTEDIVIYLPR